VRQVQLSIAPVPDWLDAARLLGTDAFVREPVEPGRSRCVLALPPEAAADLAARLRGLGIDGHALQVASTPELSRNEVRAGRLREARARRDTTPGFTRPGARASGEGRYSLTPEALALALGQRARGRAVIDACCGSGGNTIGFARAGSQVVAIELDRQRLEEARHNAAIYGVLERITFVQGDAREQLPRWATAQPEALCFVDPPWGSQYDKRASALADFPLLSALLALPATAERELWLKLPGSFAVASLPGAEPGAWFGLAEGDQHRLKFLLLRRPR
jgi:RNA cap guanine-N2 methyltransferase